MTVTSRRKVTVINIQKLIEKKILSTTSLALYFVLEVHSGEALSLSKLSKGLGQSVTSIVHHIKMLELLRLIKVERQKKPKRNIYTTASLNDSFTLRLLSSNNSILSKIDTLKDTKINKYHPKASSIKEEEIKDIRRGRCTTALSESLKLVLSKLPSKYITTVVVRPQQEAKLKLLSEKIDLAVYVKWFMAKKLGVTVDRFSLGIFLYDGMIDEYKVVRGKWEKAQRYKKKDKVSKEAIDESDKRLEEELYVSNKAVQRRRAAKSEKV